MEIKQNSDLAELGIKEAFAGAKPKKKVAKKEVVKEEK